MIAKKTSGKRQESGIGITVGCALAQLQLFKRKKGSNAKRSSTYCSGRIFQRPAAGNTALEKLSHFNFVSEDGRGGVNAGGSGGGGDDDPGGGGVGGGNGGGRGGRGSKECY